MRNLLRTAALSLLLAASLLACSRSEKREWNASDHDHPEEKPSPQRAAAPTPPPPGTAADDPWASSCAPCHGASGKGDGPMGPALRVPDIANKDWQAKVSDEQIAETIRNGRGRMPGFSSMPKSSVDALVKRVRSFR